MEVASVHSRVSEARPGASGFQVSAEDMIDTHTSLYLVYRCGAFDFPTKGILQEAMRKNQLWRLRDSAGEGGL